MLPHPASIPLSTRSLNHLADLIRTHRHQRRSRWRRLDPGRQALLALAHPIDRVHDQKPYYSGKHRRHGMNVQVIADAAGRLVWASAALPGSAHDLTAARTHGIIAALTNADVMTFADKAYQGAGGSVRTPFKRHRYRPKLSRRQKAVNKAHARIRCRGERAVATLKTWKS